ncbi:MAG: carboxypeptidase-like regulatory domain-containing protein, partial [Acidobacteria bacterium]|nr:carboxypeptidase-like regulatory domain-containing protein [Acidobacteriota bacterium]
MRPGSTQSRGPLRQAVVTLCATVLTLLTLMAPLQAQTTSGTLTGTVRTPTGDVVPQAFIQARSTATGVVRAGVSDEKGRYVLQGLPPGE